MKNKKEIVKLASEKSQFTQTDLAIAYDAFIDVIKECLINGDEVKLWGLCTFTFDHIKSYKKYDLQTGKMVDYPASTVLRIKASEGLKDAIRDNKK